MDSDNKKQEEFRVITDKSSIEYDTLKKVDINDDYFNFSGNQDIELQHLLKKLEQEELSSNSQMKISNYFTNIEKLLRKTDFSKNSFPYLTNTIIVEIELTKEKIEDLNESRYFLILIINYYQEFKECLEGFYKKNILQNEFGLSKEITQSALQINSSNYNRFVDELVRWYVSTEFIFFNLKLLEIFNGVKIPFEDKNLTLEKNYGFSLKGFAKKSLLKLSGYLVNNLSTVIGFGTIDYTKLTLLLISSFTAGFSLSNLFNVDIGLMALSVSLFANFRVVLLLITSWEKLRRKLITIQMYLRLIP